MTSRPHPPADAGSPPAHAPATTAARPALARRVEQAVSDGLDRWTRELCTPPADAGAIEYASWLRLLRRVGP